MMYDSGRGSSRAVFLATRITLIRGGVLPHKRSGNSQRRFTLMTTPYWKTLPVALGADVHTAAVSDCGLAAQK